jgi:hypothetical protein
MTARMPVIRDKPFNLQLSKHLLAWGGYAVSVHSRPYEERRSGWSNPISPPVSVVTRMSRS